jgi:hypothetical protein
MIIQGQSELTEAEETRNHELSTVAHSIDSAVLDNNTLVSREERLQRMDDLAQVRLVALVVVHPLRVHHVVQGYQALVLIHSTTAHTPELLHVSTDTKQETQMDAESPNVRSGLAADPEDAEVPIVVELKKLALVDGADTELALDGGNERRTLEQRAGQSLQSASELGLAAGDLVMETDHANVFFSGALLRLHEAGCAVDADDQTSGNLGIEGAAVASFLGPFHRGLSANVANVFGVKCGCYLPQNPLHPRHDLVA